MRGAARNGLTTTVAAICWLIAGVLVVLFVLRLLGLDSRSTLLIGLSTAWPLVVLPGLLVVIGAAVLRWRSLIVAAVVLVVIVAAAWFPCWTGKVGAGPSGASHLRLLALNVEYSQNTGAAASRQIKANNPDVVVLSELSPLTLRHLDLHQYPYSWQRPKSDAFGQGIWSRWPLVAKTTWSDSGIEMMVVTVKAPSGDFRLYQVHTHSPEGASGRHTWQSQLKRLKGYLDAERLPVVAAGDFNASRWDSDFQDLFGGRNGIADASTGRGYLATWPSGRSWLPPVLPLDHVLVSHGIGVSGIAVLGPVGSDHRAVAANLTFSAPAA